MTQGGSFDSIVIGGGFFGCSIALALRQVQGRVLVLEGEPALMTRASYKNQARIHNGYHYPRSFLTALRSQANFARFVEDYRDAVVADFDQYYAVARKCSQVTAQQFRVFFQRIGAPLRPAKARVNKLFDPDRIEEVFTVTEFAFDTTKLAAMVARRLDEIGVEVRLNAPVRRIQPGLGELAEVEVIVAGETLKFAAGHVFNCTYSGINRLLRASDLPTIPLKQELTEIALVEPPDELRNMGVTVMCGPFFSLMPFPPRQLHSLSHVRYTPHFSWRDDLREEGSTDPRYWQTSTRYEHIIHDAQRYLPSIRGCRHVDSLWETKTLLPVSENDDSRPILFRRHHGMKRLTCVMGGKIDNIYDVLRELKTAWSEGAFL